MNHHLKALLYGTGFFLAMAAFIFGMVGLVWVIFTIPYNIGIYIIIALLCYWLGLDIVKGKSNSKKEF